MLNWQGLELSRGWIGEQLQIFEIFCGKGDGIHAERSHKAYLLTILQSEIFYFILNHF
jgi:hypothetical protein